MYIIAIIDANNQMITISKDIDCRLDPDEHINLSKTDKVIHLLGYN